MHTATNPLVPEKGQLEGIALPWLPGQPIGPRVDRQAPPERRRDLVFGGEVALERGERPDPRRDVAGDPARSLASRAIVSWRQRSARSISLKVKTCSPATRSSGWPRWGARRSSRRSGG